LLKDPAWAKAIDAETIGVAGHSQGGFTSLWIGGAKIDRDKYLAFQKGWKNNQMVPAYLRDELPLDASPALDVRDPRIKARPSPWRPASSRLSAWTKRGSPR
jgi:predicted dienelactone hydrolase